MTVVRHDTLETSEERLREPFRAPLLLSRKDINQINIEMGRVNERNTKNY